jgi:hypothetical protein
MVRWLLDSMSDANTAYQVIAHAIYVRARVASGRVKASIAIFSSITRFKVFKNIMQHVCYAMDCDQ